MTLGNEQSCQACGYDLLGSPVHGQCPECGNPFNKETGQGIMTERSERLIKGDRLLARVRTIFLLLAAVVVMGCGGLLTQVAKNPLKPLALAGVAAGLLLLGAVLSYFSQKEV